MEPGKSTELSSIAERMNRLRTRMYLEKVSGIAACEKEAFLAYCREKESLTNIREYPIEKFLSRQNNILNSPRTFREINPF